MNKKFMLYIPLAVSIIALAGVVFYTGALLVFRHDSSNDVTEMSTKTVSSMLDFSFDEEVRGIPGESLIVSKTNDIIKSEDSETLVFKATFTIENPENSCVSAIELKDSDIDCLIKDPESTSTSIVFYGTIPEEAAASKNLGNLYAEFKTLGNESSNDTFVIKAEYTSCQKDSKAIKEILGIDAVGIYEPLVQ